MTYEDTAVQHGPIVMTQQVLSKRTIKDRVRRFVFQYGVRGTQANTERDQSSLFSDTCSGQAHIRSAEVDPQILIHALYQYR